MNENIAPQPVPERIAVAFHPGLPEAGGMAEEVAAYVRSFGPAAETGVLSAGTFCSAIHGGEFKLVISLGGDGTMLRAAHAGAQSETPVLGINIGRLGFLSEFQRSGWKEGLRRVLLGEYWIENHMMLHVEHLRGSDCVGSWEVLNECAVTRGPKMILLETTIDGQQLTTYAADGLIAATPTGSTAYALAAGGPILPPELRNILLVPVAPHLSVERAIVLPEGADVSIRVYTESQAQLSCDGHPSIPVDNEDRVTARASDKTARFARVQGRGYFYRNITTRLNRNPEVMKGSA